MKTALQLASAFFAIAASAPSALAGVITVGGPNPAFGDIPPAIAAAVDGDVLLVRAGTYSQFTIDGKAISIVANTGALVTIGGPCTLRNLPAGKTVLITGLTVTGAYGGSAFTFNNNAGHVRVQQLTASASQERFSSNWYAAAVTQCADLSFVDCHFFGRAGEAGSSFGPGHQGEPAIVATGGKLTLHDSTVVGGHGIDGYYNGQNVIPGQPGAAALVGSSVIVARGCSFTGGVGGRGTDGVGCGNPNFPPTPGGAGGAGISLQGAGSSGWLIATSAAGGAGGMGGLTGCGGQLPQAPSGPSLLDPSNVITTQPGPTIQLVVPQPAREGQNLALHFIGPPGASALLLIGNGGAGYQTIPSLKDVLLVQPSLRRLAYGPIPPSGVLDVNLFVGDLGPGVDVRLVHTQAVFIGPTGQSHLASPAVVEMLDSAF
ncbi:MAG TPA: hypothetical protein VK843_10600 [Planctomycetota bacterium]|nr:hypothetical protein [Planctomycetota bacterium]